MPPSASPVLPRLAAKQILQTDSEVGLQGCSLNQGEAQYSIHPPQAPPPAATGKMDREASSNQKIRSPSLSQTHGSKCSSQPPTAFPQVSVSQEKPGSHVQSACKLVFLLEAQTLLEPPKAEELLPRTSHSLYTPIALRTGQSTNRCLYQSSHH